MSNKFVGTRISVADNVYAITIRDACASLGAIVEPRSAGIDIPGKVDEMVWCPNVDNGIWSNTISDDGLTITEYYKANIAKRKEHVKLWTSMPQMSRVTFLGKEGGYFLFVGVFRINVEKSLQKNKCIWERVLDYYNLPNANHNLYKI